MKSTSGWELLRLLNSSLRKYRFVDPSIIKKTTQETVWKFEDKTTLFDIDPKKKSCAREEPLKQ